MSGVLRTVGKVAGVIATVAMFIPGGQPIALIASAVATVASIGAEILAKPPPSTGQVIERRIGANNPLPYIIGRCYSGGLQVHDVGYGGEVDDVDNPYRWMVVVHSCCGPVDAIEGTFANFTSVPFSGGAATGYYANHWWRDTQLGARPEADALTPNFSGAPNWGTSYKLSGMAAVGHNLKWSKKGKRFAGGQLPVIGDVVRGVKVYDPRLDSTYPGGSGAQRITDENTWTYSRNPALHALAYAYGRYVNGKKVFGADLGAAAIDLASVVAWANVCDANSWNADGIIYEPGDKWGNLKAICQAGGSQPALVGGILHFDYQASRTALATITRDDLSDGPIRDQLGRSWKDRHNTIIPRYRSEANNWEWVQSDAVSVAAFVTEDGEDKIEEIQYQLVTDKDQAAELATYELYQRRENGPIALPLKAHWRDYEPGDAFTLAAELSPTGAAMKVVMRRRAVDPMNGTVNAVFEEETDAKHAAALGSVGTAPPLHYYPTPEELDDSIRRNSGTVPQAIAGSWTEGLAGNITQTHVGGGQVDVTFPAHTRHYSDGSKTSVSAQTVTVSETTDYLFYYDDEERQAQGITVGNVNVTTGGNKADAYFSETHPARHYLGRVTTVASDGSGGSTGGSGPPGSGGWDGSPDTSIP